MAAGGVILTDTPFFTRRSQLAAPPQGRLVLQGLLIQGQHVDEHHAAAALNQDPLALVHPCGTRACNSPSWTS